MWVLLWTACGAAFIHQLATMENGAPRAFMIGVCVFWLFYEVRVGRTLLWRMRGFELWRVKNGVFTIKDSIFGYGKARDWFIANISELGVLTINRSDWRFQFTDSFWTMAGERLGFKHIERRVAFGKGLLTVPDHDQFAHSLDTGNERGLQNDASYPRRWHPLILGHQ